MNRFLESVQILILEFIPHHLQNVSGVSVKLFLKEIEGFSYLQVPSMGIQVEKADFLKILTIMYNNGISDNGLIFSKKELNNISC